MKKSASLTKGHFRGGGGGTCHDQKATLTISKKFKSYTGQKKKTPSYKGKKLSENGPNLVRRKMRCSEKKSWTVRIRMYC